MRTLVVGCGSWGSRVAEKIRFLECGYLSAVLDEDFSKAADLGRRLDVSAVSSLAGFIDVMAPTHIVLALPPGQRDEAIDTILNHRWHKLPKLRIEKPLALCVGDAREIASRCEHKGIELSVGFQLLHHPAYERMIDNAKRYGAKGLLATRTGKKPAHECDAILDLGIHSAAIAAACGLTPEQATIHASYDDHDIRHTSILYADGTDYGVNELAFEPFDCLKAELEAWYAGTNRGTAQIGIDAQLIIDSYYDYFEDVA